MKNKIVFSTDPDFEFKSEEDIVEQIAKGQQNLRIWLEKRPGNKVVSIIKNYVGTQSDMKELERKIKRKCGVGGSIKGRDIVIQTKDRNKILNILEDLGYAAKLSGG